VPGLSGLSVIARGGYSTVYRARQDSVGREVALKIDTRSFDDERDRRRFLREAEAAGRMSGHPNIVHVYDAGVTGDNHPYLVMELCTGGSYATRLKRHGPLPPAEARDVGVRIADALSAAHRAGILHRDVKPGNILVNAYGVPGLADFGLAALPDPTREVSVTVEALTPAYAPPEVFRLERPTPAGDVYGLAATLYALLSGRPPRWPDTGTPSLATMVRLHEDPLPDLPGVPVGLTNVLRTAMAAEPEDRYPTAAAFRDALDAVDLDPATAPPRPGSAPPRPPAGPPVPGPRAPSSGPPGSWPPGAPAPGAPSSGPPGPWSPGAGPPGPPSSGGPGSWPPVSGPPGSWPPVSSPPGAPSSGPPGSWSPVSAPPGGPPRSGPPTPPYPSAPVPPRSRRGAVVAGVAGGVVLLLLLVGGIVLADTLDRTDTGPSASATPTGDGGTAGGTRSPAATPTLGPSGVPPSGVPDLLGPCPLNTFGLADVVCPTTPECFGGITVISGEARAARTSCTRRHTWQTFLSAELPSTVTTPDMAVVKKLEIVTVLCGRDSLAIALKGKPSVGWETEVLPPTQAQFDAGERTFRCLAGKGADGLSAPVFGTE